MSLDGKSPPPPRHKRIIILSGMPGSGKTYYTKNILPKMFPDRSIITVSADDYWGPEYNFVRDQLHEAHRDCRRKFISFLKTGSNQLLLVVDNTHLTPAEAAFYYEYADLFGPVEIHRILPWEWDPDEYFKTCCERNIHKVPHGTMKGMWFKFNHRADFPKYWNVKKVFTRKDGSFEVDNVRYLTEANSSS